MPEQPIRLRGLLRSRFGQWNLALFLGAVTLLSATGLLATSGWFISAAALAGLATVAAYGFDYFRPAAIIRFFAIVRTAGRYAERLASHNAALALLKDLRTRLFARVAGQRRLTPAARSAIAMHRLVADIDLLDFFPLRFVAPWFWASTLSLLVLGWLALLDSSLAVAALPGLLLAWMVVPLLGGRLAARLARRDAELAEQRREFLLDRLQLLTSLLLWQRWNDQQAAFLQQDDQWLQQRLRQQKLVSLTALGQQCGLALALLAVLWQGHALLQAGELGVPWLLAALLSVMGLVEALLPLAASFISLGFSQAARDRLNQLTAAETDPASTATALPAQPLSLALSGLSARVPGALNGPEDVSVKLQQGDVLLIEGPSGGGKSTLLQVLAGEPLAFTGERLLNGQGFERWDLRELIGYLPQQLDIFDMTLAQNLRLADLEATDEALWQVLEDVALADWVRSRKHGLKTTLGEFGAKVSGGQARRIALARLLLTKRPLLLLDEPFAGLDVETRERVLASLLRRREQGIIVIVSHQQVAVPEARHLRIG